MKGIVGNVRLLFLYNITIPSFLISLKLESKSEMVGKELDLKHAMLCVF